MLYEVAILKKEKSKIEKPDGSKETKEKEVIVLPPTPVTAPDDKVAAMKCLMDNKDKIGDTDLADVQVLVRPFA